MRTLAAKKLREESRKKRIIIITRHLLQAIIRSSVLYVNRHTQRQADGQTDRQAESIGSRIYEHAFIDNTTWIEKLRKTSFSTWQTTHTLNY